MKPKKLKRLLLVLMSLLFVDFIANAFLFFILKGTMTLTVSIILGIIIFSSIIIIIFLHLLYLGILKLNRKTIKRLDDALNDSLSEKEQLEERKNDLEIQLRHTQKLETIGTLAGGMAHDFNNLLAPILGYSDLVLSQLTHDNTLYLYVNEIVRAANKAKDQVEQILKFSEQIEHGNKDVDLESIIRETVTIIRPLIPSTVDILLDIGDDESYISADPSAIHQILVNICTNGWQAMEESGGKLTISLNRKLEDDDFIALSISDTGSGIDIDTKLHIFEPFFSTRINQSSSGLGLSVVQGILSSINGSIEVDSIAGFGSTFTVYLPRKRNTNIKLENNPLNTIAGHILVVDDDENITNMICNMLSDFGFNIELFSNSHDALQAFKEQPDKFNLVITDLTMPNITGSSLKSEMEKIRNDIPVLIMTGYGTRPQNSNSRILRKPFIKAELISAIEDMMQK